MYMDSGDTGLVGFYGKTTVEDYINRPGGGFRSKPKKEKQEKKEVGGKESGEGDGRKGSLSRWLSSKKSGSKAG